MVLTRTIRRHLLVTSKNVDLLFLLDSNENNIVLSQRLIWFVKRVLGSCGYQEGTVVRSLDGMIHRLPNTYQFLHRNHAFAENRPRLNKN